MPWPVKRILVLIVLGFAAAGLAVAVLVRDHDDSGDHRLLAIGLLVGAAAMVVVALPGDGPN